MQEPSTSSKKTMELHWSLALHALTDIQWVSSPITASCFRSHHSKVPTLSSLLTNVAYPYSFYKTFQVSWLGKTMRLVGSQKMGPKWSLLFRQPEFQKLRS